MDRATGCSKRPALLALVKYEKYSESTLKIEIHRDFFLTGINYVFQATYLDDLKIQFDSKLLNKQFPSKRI